MANCASRECNTNTRARWTLMALTGFARVQRRDFYVLPRHGGVFEQRRGCCNLVGGGQKPFITKMPAGMSLWSPRDDCASVGVGVHTGWSLLFTALPPCGQAFLHSPRGLLSTTLPHLLSPSLCRSFALCRRQRGRGSTRHKAPGTPPTPTPTPTFSHPLRVCTHKACSNKPERRDAWTCTQRRRDPPFRYT